MADDVIKMSLDAGHHSTKFGDFAKSMIFPSLIARANKDTEDRIMIRRNQKTDYFVVGTVAMAYQLLRAESTERYNAEYIGTLFCQAAYEYLNNYLMLKRPNMKGRDFITMKLMVTYPPGDMAYTKQLQEALTGHWIFERNGSKYNVTVQQVITIPEGAASYYNMCFNDKDMSLWPGSFFPHSDDKYLYVIDIGGYTTDLCLMNPLTAGGGYLRKLNKEASTSLPIGGSHLREALITAIRKDSEGNSVFRRVEMLNRAVLDEAIMNGGYVRYGSAANAVVDLSHVFAATAQKFSNDLFSRVRNHAGRLGVLLGGIILTGGEGYTLKNYVIDSFPEQQIRLAVFDEKDYINLVFANQRGAFKLGSVK